MRDLSNNVSLSLPLAPLARTASANGATIDLLGYGSAAVAFIFGAWTDGTHTPKLQASDDNATWVDVPSTDMTGAAYAAVSASSGANKVQKAGYIGNRRYIRPVLTIASATTGAVSGAVAVLGKPSSAPAA